MKTNIEFTRIGAENRMHLEVARDVRRDHLIVDLMDGPVLRARLFATLDPDTDGYYLNHATGSHLIGVNIQRRHILAPDVKRSVRMLLTNRKFNELLCGEAEV